ncbi:CSC1-like protein At3g54510 isoform X2 [Punica granatum]|uniref:CSC1-like protein At3g54510 isoform X2 n=1 Tax=Punica granatum TaxID=22663 RepID=A0A6P8C5M3_PUNGR|nr:CSC1-like protein At3g54510 isoform X2 [Punica granatum]
MHPQSLLASATINIGMAFLVLSLFSIFKKQPSTAPVYYARRLSQRSRVPFDPPLTFRRFTPSVSWILRAFRVTEDEVIESSGLDALIIIRLFKFGIKFFVVCSLIGVVILLPVNYNGQDGPPLSYNSLDAFTISNIRRGSNRLWVHFSCLCFISFYGLYLLNREYYEILSRRIQRLQHIRHRPDQFTVLVRGIPFCPEHKARSCHVDHFFSKHYLDSYSSYQMLYHGSDIEGLLDQAKSTAKKIEELKKTSTVKRHDKELLLENGTREDFAKIALHEEKLQELSRKVHQLQSESVLKGKELAAAFVTFRSRQGASLVAQSQQHPHPLLWITETAPEPRDVSWKNLAIPHRILPLNKIFVILASTLLTLFFAVPVTAVQGIAKFEKLKEWFPPAMAVQLIPGLRSIVTGYLPSVILNGFIYVIPFAMLGIAKLAGCISKSKEELKACNMVFYFLVGNVFFLSLLSGSLLDEIGESVTHPKNFPSHLARAVSAQIQDVYETVYDTCGKYWTCVHHYIIVAIILMQVTMIGLFGLKSKPAASICTVLLLLLSLLFDRYCKIRFYPTFRHYTVQNARENDELDKKSNLLQENYQNAVTAYRPPFLRPVEFVGSESSSTQPLVSTL